MLALVFTCGPALAQERAAGGTRVPPRPERVTLQSDALFYGDNTEFRNPFREGETIFGTSVRLAVAADITDRVRFSLGVFGNLRFGGDDAFELVRPIVALEIHGRRSSFVFGTLPGPHVGDPPGPDQTGPHGLLPPIQRETLEFERPYEAGLQWRFNGTRLRHEMWLNWQKVNTPEHRERLDAGVGADFGIAGPFAVPIQLHVVHDGGQLFASGAVADSVALATGIVARGRLGRLDAAAVEIYGLLSHFVPDRSTPERSRDGGAFFGRVSGRRGGWRGHILFWRGDDFVKVEGDPNYQSIRRDGSRYRGVRDYSEAGLTRTFRLAEAALIETSARVHRVEKDYGYSYRVVAIAGIGWRLR
jgi:hypothetical protein